MNKEVQEGKKSGRIRRWRMFRMIIKNTYADKVWSQFLIGYFVSAFLVQLVEPEINGYGNGLWYLFAAATTVGFGDMAAVTLIGRLLTVYIAVSGMLVVAVVPAVIINFYQEAIQLRQKETVTAFLEQLEHLPELSKEELQELSDQVKQLKY